MASIKKLDNGSYQATVYIGRDENGKRINEYVTKRGLKECKAAARKIEQERDEGKLTHLENVRVAEYIKKWLEANKNSYSPSTYVLYLSYLKNHYKPFFKERKFKELRTIHAQQFANELLGKMSSTSARRSLSCLRRIMHDAMKDKSPFKDLKLPKEKKVDYSDVPKTAEKFKIIHDAVRGTIDEPIILLAAWCGLRREEIFALKPNDFDFKNNVIRIDEAYVINDLGKYELKETKSENGMRDVMAPPYLMNLLKDVIKNGFGKKRKVKKFTGNISENHRYTIKKRPISESKVTEITSNKNKSSRLIFDMRPDSYSSRLAKLVRDKKIPKTRLHYLRHYHATWLYEQGVPDLYSADRLGHDIKVLKKIYQHLGVEKRNEVDRKIIDLQQGEIK